MKRNALNMLSAAGLLGGALLTTACESPDTQQRMDDYSEIVGDAPPAPEGLCPPQLADISGRFLLAIEHNFIPGIPIYFDLAVTATGENKYDLSFQPLSNPVGNPSPDPAIEREQVGTPIVVTDVQVGPNGLFTIPLERIVVVGAANAATGSDIEATLMFDVSTCDADRICGQGNFDLFRPLTLAGKTAWFSAERLGEGEIIMTDNGIKASCD